MTFLAIDVGNTRLKWALYAAPHPGATLLHHGAAFLETIDDLAEGDWQELPEPSSMLGCIVAGDAVRRRVEQQMELWDIDPRWVVPSSHEAGLISGYDHPNRLGADRWVALAGARSRSPSTPSTPKVVFSAASFCPASASCCGRWRWAPPVSRCRPAKSSTFPPTPATP
jgi:type III pantothenate kinase